MCAVISNVVLPPLCRPSSGQHECWRSKFSPRAAVCLRGFNHAKGLSLLLVLKDLPQGRFSALRLGAADISDASLVLMGE